MSTSETAFSCVVRQGPNHGPSPLPQNGGWKEVRRVSDLNGLTHGCGTCAPHMGACKLTVNVQAGVIREALIENIGCSGMTHAAAMAAEILPDKTLLEAMNTDLVCDAINKAMREVFLQMGYGRTQSSFSDGGLPVGSAWEDLGPGARSQVGTSYGTSSGGVRYLDTTEGHILRMALDENDEVIGYEFVNVGKMMSALADGASAEDALQRSKGTYGRFEEGTRFIDPRRSGAPLASITDRGVTCNG